MNLPWHDLYPPKECSMWRRFHLEQGFYQKSVKITCVKIELVKNVVQYGFCEEMRYNMGPVKICAAVWDLS